MSLALSDDPPSECQSYQNRDKQKVCVSISSVTTLLKIDAFTHLVRECEHMVAHFDGSSRQCREIGRQRKQRCRLTDRAMPLRLAESAWINLLHSCRAEYAATVSSDEISLEMRVYAMRKQFPFVREMSRNAEFTASGGHQTDVNSSRSLRSLHSSCQERQTESVRASRVSIALWSDSNDGFVNLL